MYPARTPASKDSGRAKIGARAKTEKEQGGGGAAREHGYTIDLIVAMGSPLGPVLANIFMCHFEEKWVFNASVRPSFWYRYVDDAFTMFDSKDTANEFLRYLNSRHSSIKFTIEFEQDNEIPFLDILVKRCPDNSFMTSVYRKKTFTGLYTK